MNLSLKILLFATTALMAGQAYAAAAESIHDTAAILAGISPGSGEAFSPASSVELPATAGAGGQVSRSGAPLALSSLHCDQDNTVTINTDNLSYFVGKFSEPSSPLSHITKLKLTKHTLIPFMAAFADADALSRISHIKSLSIDIGRSTAPKDFWTALERLKDSLTNLTIHGKGVDVPSLVAIDWKYLNYLSLEGCSLGDKGARAIAESEHMANLQTLKLSYNNISVDGAKAIANSVHMANLRSLNLSINHIEVDGARDIADSVHMANLRRLYLSFNHISVEGAKAIADSVHMTNLQSLDLSANNIGDNGVRAIVESAYMANLQSLDLSANNIGDEGAKTIVDSVYMANLQRLDLSANKIEPDGARAITDSICMSQLRTLNLSYNYIGDEGATAISGSVHMPELRILELNANRIGDKGARAIAESEHMTKLQSLFLYYNEISDVGQAVLKVAAARNCYKLGLI